MRKKRTKSVNLLSPVQPPEDVFTIFYNWILTAGKILLISIQIVVIVVFVVRLYLDRANNDLTREINDNIAVLSRPEIKDEEELYRRVQFLFKDITLLDQNQERNAKRIVSILDSIPSYIILEKFSFNNYRVTGDFIAHSFEDVRAYENFLKQSPNYYDVRLSLESHDESEIEFEVSYRVRKGGED
jgi:hypothetical protein